MKESRSPNPAALIGTLTLAGIVAASVACTVPNPYLLDCFQHCWSTTIEFDEEGYLEGAACENSRGGSFVVPSPIELLGRACLETQREQDSVNAVITAISADDTESLSQEQIDDWYQMVHGLRADIHASCIAFVTGAPNAHDIDPDAGGTQVCMNNEGTHALCAQLVDDVISERFDLALGSGTALPEYAGSVASATPDSDCEFAPQYGSTGDVDPSTSDDGGPMHGSGSTDGNSGADSSGGETSGFGDVDGRIECTSSTQCSVDASLLRDIADHFTTFYAEGVVLSIIPASTPCNSAGAVLSGLDPGDDAKALADAFGLRNGDIISIVEGIQLSSMDKAADIIDDLSSSSDPINLTINRRANNSCRAFNLTLTIQ